MIWIPLLSALSGAVIGGGITLLGQWLADRRGAKAKLDVEDRSRRLVAVERKRGYIVELYDQVCQDLAWADDQHNRSGERVNQDRADTLDDVRRTLEARQTTAAAAIALVEDENLKHAIAKLYSVYVGYLVTEAADMDQEFVDHNLTRDDVLKCRVAAGAAVGSALRRLQAEEARIFSPACSPST